VRRGEIWTVAGGTDYAGKPRPALIVQDDRFPESDSITVCILTTNLREAPLVRIPVVPDNRNGLREPSQVMIDKISSVRKSKVGFRIGALAREDMLRVDRSLVVFLGLTAGSLNPPLADE
jgi:mRNA interferase MazF